MQTQKEVILRMKKFETTLMVDGFSYIKKAVAIFENQD